MPWRVWEEILNQPNDQSWLYLCIIVYSNFWNRVKSISWKKPLLIKFLNRAKISATMPLIHRTLLTLAWNLSRTTVIYWTIWKHLFRMRTQGDSTILLPMRRHLIPKCLSKSFTNQNKIWALTSLTYKQMPTKIDLQAQHQNLTKSQLRKSFMVYQDGDWMRKIYAKI